jgi:AcrR family transcriptional regulator
MSGGKREALLEILPEKPIEAVTVTELCHRADLNRGTFYLHYGSPAELLEDIEDDLFERLTAPLLAAGADSTDSWGLAVLRELVADPTVARIALQPGSTLVERFFAVKRERMRSVCRAKFPDLGESELAYVRTFFEQGSVAVVRAWLADGMVEAPEGIASVLARLT